MKISTHWLNEFVEAAPSASALARDLTRLGLNVESYAKAGDDWVFDVEVTSNRPDCLSHFGVAREAATFYQKSLKPISVRVKESGVATSGAASIEIAAPDLCARYCGRVVRNVQVKPSPDWLRRRLEAIGQRPINNVADVTNYVLMELGHPLHAFDLARLRQSKIIVRRARPGETLRTLDGVDRKLTADNLVIADAERAVALAGVMGGEDSEISFSTTSVLLESAWFNPISIRRTAKSHGLHTEASHRFERGADVEMAPLALDRAAALITEVAGGEILKGIIDVYPAPRTPVEITLEPKEIVRVLGSELGAGEVERILRSLGFSVARQAEGEWRVVVPSWRLDVTRDVDLVEELARHYGYDRLPSRVRAAPPKIERDALRETELEIVATLVSLGYRQIIPSPMIDPEENARFTSLPPVILQNPLSQDASALRSTPVPSMIHALRWNLDRGRTDVRFFEVGKAYIAPPQGKKELPDERRVLTLGATGYRRPASVHDSEKPLDFFDVKGDIESLLAIFAVNQLRLQPADCGYFKKGQSARFIVNEKAVATAGALNTEFASLYKLKQSVWLAEIDLDGLLALPVAALKFMPFSRFPSVDRDFSLLVPEGVSYSRIEDSIRGLNAEEIQSVRPVEQFRGGNIPAGAYSLLLRVIFQSSSRTLAGEDVDRLSGLIISALKPLGVHLRGGAEPGRV